MTSAELFPENPISVVAAGGRPDAEIEPGIIGDWVTLSLSMVPARDPLLSGMSSGWR